MLAKLFSLFICTIYIFFIIEDGRIFDSGSNIYLSPVIIDERTTNIMKDDKSITTVEENRNTYTGKFWT